MSQAFLNRHFPWYIVVLINFMNLMILAYLIVAIASKYVSWAEYDAQYIAIGACIYSYNEYKLWRKKDLEDIQQKQRERCGS